MKIALPVDDDPRREEIRGWIADHPSPTGRELAEAGWVVPHWPAPWGHDADPLHQILIDEELRAAKIHRPYNPIGIGWAGPTILQAGTDEQKNRHLWPILAGEEIWCQLFSEPGAGSDLANLATRAVADGESYIVTGSKIWTSYAHQAQFGILLARTDPDVPKHQGVSYFICPMDAHGITVRPIKDMTGLSNFNEVFFDEVRIPAANLVGRENAGWELAKVTLANERVSLSTGGVVWGGGPTIRDLVAMVRQAGGLVDPVMRQRIAASYVEGELLRFLRLRSISALIQGRQPGPEASVGKVLSDSHAKKVLALAKDLAGPYAMLADGGPHHGLFPDGFRGKNPSGMAELVGSSTWSSATWALTFLASPAFTIGGGTEQIQHNIIAERALGLPHDIDVESGVAWSEARRSRSSV